MIYGNKTGVRDSVLAELEALYELTCEQEVFAPPELIDKMAAVSCAINREISVYISRSGSVLDVSIGDLGTVGLRDIRLRRNPQRLSRVRCIHTHPGGDAHLSDVDLSSLRSMRFDAMAAIGVRDGQAIGIQAAFLADGDAEGVRLTRVVSPARLPQRAWMDAIFAAEQAVRVPESAALETGEAPERAYLVGLEDDKALEELARLAESAGATVIGRLLQKKQRPDTATYLGSGKVEELSLRCQAADVDLVIFDDELSGVQIRNLEAALGRIRVVDRTALILDIFAQRAKSREGRLQVELAQMAYQLPRLTGHGVSMSRLGGGIGTRGPGETRLEMDRRRIRRRIADLRGELRELEGQRSLRRTRRASSGLPSVALVGYTNAGKTTLLNQLSGAEAEAEDKLFATLDPLVRTVRLPSGGTILLTDTVGFVSKLPHTLVDAFRSTLEETIQADLLLIVSDGASPEVARQHDVVMQVLAELGAADKPHIDVLNKADLGLAETPIPGAIPISAKLGEGIKELLAVIEGRLGLTKRRLSVLVPYDRGDLVAKAHTAAQIESEDYEAEGTRLVLLADEELTGRLISLLGSAAVTFLSPEGGGS